MNSERMAPKLPHICCNHTLPAATGGRPQSVGSQLPQYESWYSNGFACKSANHGKVGIHILSMEKKKGEVGILSKTRIRCNIAVKQ
jgi:hypothetical protein